jgi:hypothetical protein
MSDAEGLSPEELAGESATVLPDKEVVSILDLNADLNLAIDAAAPIDLAAAANANIAAPINASADANVLSIGSDAQSMGDQGALINQNIDATATAHSVQDSGIDQGGTVPAGDTGSTDPGAVDPSGATSTTTADPTAAGAADGPLLNVDVNLDGNVGVAAPVDGAVAANANAAAPINASVGANVGSVDSHAISVAQQDAIINQNISGSATADTDQSSTISQP